MQSHGGAESDVERVWTLRTFAPGRFADAVEALPAGPVTTLMQARVAMHRQEDARAVELLAEAEPAITDDLWRARLLETRGNLLRPLGMVDEAREAFAEAWELFDAVGDPVGRASVRQNHAILPFHPVETRHRLLTEALGLAEEAGEQALVGVVLLNIASTGDSVGMTPDEIDAVAVRAGELLDGLWPEMALRVHCQRIETSLETGDLDIARAAAREVPDVADIEDQSVRSHAATALGLLHLREGRPDAAADLFERALALGVPAQNAPDTRRRLGRALAAAGRYAEAAEHLDAAYDENVELMTSERVLAARALDAVHHTEMLRRERQLAAERADALERALAELQVAARRLHETSIRDTVTGLHNRQFLLEHAPGLVDVAGPSAPGPVVTGAPSLVAVPDDVAAGAGVSGRGAQVGLIDLDSFKAVNDTFGHLAGDAILRTFAAALRAHLPGTDLVARYGGEEFVVVRPAPAEGVPAMPLEHDLERLRGAMTQVAWHDADRSPLPAVTLSAGVVDVRDGSLADSLRRADSVMYAAKRSGRDVVLVEGADGTLRRADGGAPAAPDGAPARPGAGARGGRRPVVSPVRRARTSAPDAALGAVAQVPTREHAGHAGPAEHTGHMLPAEPVGPARPVPPVSSLRRVAGGLAPATPPGGASWPDVVPRAALVHGAAMPRTVRWAG